METIQIKNTTFKQMNEWNCKCGNYGFTTIQRPFVITCKKCGNIVK